MKILLLSALIALILIPATSAHNTTWYWGKGTAENAILDEGLQWDSSFDEVYDARCYPWGKWIPSNSGKYRLWKHFRCIVSTFDDEDYWISFHVTSKYTWTFSFMRWAN